jgi:hypothetical protein
MEPQLNLKDIPQGHGAFSFEDAEKCPYSKMKQTGDASEPKKDQKSKDVFSEDELSSADEDEAAQTSGCPVMSKCNFQSPKPHSQKYEPRPRIGGL